MDPMDISLNDSCIKKWLQNQMECAAIFSILPKNYPDE